MSANAFPGVFPLLIARLIADPATLSARLDAAIIALEAEGLRLAQAEMLEFCSHVLELMLPEGDAATLSRVLDAHFQPSDLIVSDAEFGIPHVFVSDMDSTMIGQECTERAMQGELDFESALRERVLLLKDLPDSKIAECLTSRVRPMAGAKTLVETLKSHGCKTVLVTGGFHHFADPVAEMLGFERVVANNLEVAGGTLTGGLFGTITDSGV
jgi:phosphoserine phosphatase